MVRKWSMYQNASSWWCFFLANGWMSETYTQVSSVSKSIDNIYKFTKPISLLLQSAMLLELINKTGNEKSYVCLSCYYARAFPHSAILLFYLPVLFSFLVCLCLFRHKALSVFNVCRMLWCFWYTVCSCCSSIALSSLSYFWNCLNSCCAVLEVVYNISFSFKTCELSKPMMSLMLYSPSVPKGSTYWWI